MSNKEIKETKKLNKSKILAIILWILIALGIIVAIIGGSIGYKMIKNAPEINVDDFYSSDSTIVYDANGEIVAELGIYLRENIEYEEMPQSLIDAFVSIEDSRFFEHNGFDIPRFTKAIIENLKTMSFGQGGSTFTMQLIKNTYFQIDDDENSTIAQKSIDRKVQEIYLATKLEKLVSKEDIIEMYLNKLNFGSNIRGVQKAAQYYFNKNASDLTISESALLAGIINRPNAYNPYKYLDYATDRRNTVLDMMKYHGYITENECALAKAIKVEDQLSGIPNNLSQDGKAPYQSYIDTVIEEAKALTNENPYQTPMKIYTSMDKNTQETIDSLQNGTSDIQFNNDLMQLATVVLNNQTGEIVAIGGGRNQEGERLFNRATQSFIQPGSSVKPFLSYALAFEYLGWSTAHVVTDRPIVYRGTNKVIKNFSGNYEGDLTLMDALGKSLNTPAIQTLQEVVDTVGRSTVIEYLQSIGFSKVTTDNFDLGFAIGGSAFLVSPLELANAHATMINLGAYNTPHTITKIIYNNKTEINPTYTEKQVISEGSAYLADQLMLNAVSSSYSNYMQLLQRNYPIYGKTGTTDWGEEGLQYNIPKGIAKDLWMVGSSSKYTTCVWMGFDKGILDEKTYFDSADYRLNYRGQVIKLLLDTVHENESEKPKAIERPDEIEDISFVQGTFPYVSADSGIGNVVTGLIKKEFNKTVSIYDSSKKTQLESISGWADEYGTYQVTFGGFGYTDENGNYVKDLSVTYIDDNGVSQTVQAIGRVLFDYSWVLGYPHFAGKLYINDNYIQDFSSDSPNYYGTYDAGTYGSNNIKVCGYYYYDSGAASNEQCAKIR